MAASAGPADDPAPYARLVLPQTARALALLDEDPASPTCGCFDRAFWHYRTLVDFPGAGWQQLVWPLALFDRARPGTPRLREAVGAGLLWWSRIQHRDGSFDEWYRNEHSYCPTAFTTAAACEALLILGAALPEAVRGAALAAAERAGAWLKRRFNPAVMNQNLAAALALWDLAALTGSARWRRAAEDRYRRVAQAQHAEGWLPEYGGADFGYATLALDLLAAGDARGAGDLVRDMAGRLAGFLFAVQGAGPGHAGRLGSRGTAHVFPYGAEH
ncbi:MAG: hypothetical protein IRY94_03705, partial [Rhodospirillaceae bacterium]|nr:hypothetical protein [Rhodospirillaceae bacterium]